MVFHPSSPLARLFQTLPKIAQSSLPIFIQGETGSGKEQVARAIHQFSKRKGLFLAINCSTLEGQLVDSELFGHLAGAFTGAHVKRKGKLEEANGGTLFLDEIAELPQTTQTKLLRVIQERKVTPLGSNCEIDSDLNIITATHESLEKKVRSKEFRLDLYYRLKVCPIEIPPLRARSVDIPILAQHFWSKIQQNTPILDLSQAELNSLLKYNFPGNVRELENILSRYSLFREVGMQLEELLQPAFPPQQDESNQAKAFCSLKTEQVWEEKTILFKTLKENRFNKSKTAQSLGISRGALDYRLKKWTST